MTLHEINSNSHNNDSGGTIFISCTTIIEGRYDFTEEEKETIFKINYYYLDNDSKNILKRDISDELAQQILNKLKKYNLENKLNTLNEELLVDEKNDTEYGVITVFDKIRANEINKYLKDIYEMETIPRIVDFLHKKNFNPIFYNIDILRLHHTDGYESYKYRWLKLESELLMQLV